MPEQVESHQFHFVNSTIDSPNVLQDVATRALIRKQAMKKASAARKKNGAYGKHNLRQYPVFIDEKVQPPAEIPEPKPWPRSYSDQRIVPKLIDGPVAFLAEVVPTPQRTAARRPRVIPSSALYVMAKSIPASVPPTPFESIAMSNRVNILDLANLTTFHVSRATRTALSTDPTQVVNLLQYNQWSFFSFLQSCYERSVCVKNAVDCVVARVKQIFSPLGPDMDHRVISLYLKALGSLQKALDCPKQQLSAEVLYAIEILALYELLAPNEPAAWIRHSAGASRLIQVRGPTRYTTEFEKSLLMAHVGAIATESMLNNEKCFLEDEPWRRVLQSLIQDDSTLSDRSEIVISLLIHKSKIAGICHDATTALCSGAPLDPVAGAQLAGRAQQLRDDLMQWRTDHEHLFGPISELYRGRVEDDKLCKLAGVYLSCIMLASRLVSSIFADQRLRIEDEVESLATQVLSLHERVAALRPQATLFLAQTVAIAQGLLATTELWREDTSGIIDRWKFEKLCEVLGRKVT